MSERVLGLIGDVLTGLPPGRGDVTVVSATPPALLRCIRCAATMRTPPAELRADLVVLAMLRFLQRHEGPTCRAVT